MLGNELQSYISQKINSYFCVEQEILSASAVHGGSINSCFHLKTTKGSYFVKINDAKEHPGMFEAEAKGLELLKTAGAFRIPEFFFVEHYNDLALLLMEFIPSGNTPKSFWRDFAESLSSLHRKSASEFGLDHDNYMGSIQQVNGTKNSWSDFFVENRLMVQEKIARDSNKISSELSKRFEKLYNKVENLFPKEKPALVHGDLWSGNYLCDANGKAVLIDPAVYYGHREVDIAMTKLFGGFNEEMYKIYNQEFPLEKGWEERIDLCNLYPLMVHVNLFGGAYVRQVEACLKHFV